MESSHYDFSNYTNIERWSSYWHQINIILSLQPVSILEIGKGDGVVGYYLKNTANLNYTSFDNDNSLKPDIVGSIENIKAEDNYYDMVCAFEVLEHLPFEKFAVALKEMSRVSKKYVVISLPRWGRHFAIEIKLPFFGKIKGQYKVGLFPLKHNYNGEHYWEIGKLGFSLAKIKNEIAESGLELINCYNSFESPYHQFFILGKAKQNHV
jgi:ubiquinone/menaquinone biosynthesis C-methylase UbiE